MHKLQPILCLLLALTDATDFGDRPDTSSTAQSRIVGGRKCVNEDHRFYVGLHKPLGVHKCGGSLLSRWWVLTVAHNQEDGLFAVVGFQNATITPYRASAKVLRYFIHPKFENALSGNDVAVAQLRTPLLADRYVQYVKLPLKPYSGVLEEEACFNVLAMGFGTLDWEDFYLSDVLNCVYVQTISMKRCEEIYEDDHLFDVICTNTLNKDSCQGDSGGPMLCNGVQYGIVSWGEGCGSGLPGVYARVDRYLGFIRGAMEFMRSAAGDTHSDGGIFKNITLVAAIHFLIK